MVWSRTIEDKYTKELIELYYLFKVISDAN